MGGGKGWEGEDFGEVGGGKEFERLFYLHRNLENGFAAFGASNV